jgi:uncharacterized protein
MKKEKTVQLVINEACNLNCIYCYGKSRSKRTMPISLATAIVSKHLMEDYAESSKIHIEFVGGEPLLSLEILTSVVEFVTSRSRKWKKPFSFQFTTNGTLLTPSVKAWLDRHPCVGFGISIDGTRTAHNLNRSNSYDMLEQHISWMVNRCNLPIVKMTISNKTIPHIFDGISHLHSLGFSSIAANVPYEDIWGQDLQSSLHIFAHELNKLVHFYSENQHLTPTSLVDLPIFLDTMQEPHDDGFFPRWCGSGHPMICYDIDGNSYPCHRFVPCATGHSLAYVGPPELPLKLNKDIDPNTVMCAACPFLKTCPSCCANNWAKNGDVDHRTNFHCGFILLQIKATAKLHCLKLAGKIEERKKQGNLEGFELSVSKFNHALSLVHAMNSGSARLMNQKRDIEAEVVN